MSLRDAVNTFRVPRNDTSWRARDLEKTVTRLAQQWGDRESRTPPAFELESTLTQVKRTWQERRSLEDLGRREKRFLPYVLFHPPGEPREWVTKDTAFNTAFLGTLTENPRGLATTGFVLLRDYPRTFSPFEQLRGGYAQRLSADRSIRAETWRTRHGTFKLFAPDGPEYLAKRICDAEGPTERMLAEAGLVNELSSGAFMRNVHARVLAILQDRLAEQAGLPSVEPALGALRTAEDRLRFEDLAGDIGNALLLPHTRVIPLPATKGLLERFLLTHLRDPRIHTRKWQGVDAAAKAIFMRWLVGATLEDFFRLIERHALERHWRYRQAFWGAYLKNDLIDDACVVLGENARALAKQVFRAPGFAFSSLKGGNRDHSVLLMRIGGMTISEWSHNGRLRFWLPENKKRPTLHQLSYTRDELTSDENFYKDHHGSEHYTWQRTIAEFLQKQVGVRVMSRDFML